MNKIYIFFLLFLFNLFDSQSILIHSGDRKIIVVEGEDTLIPCTIRKSLANDTVLWRNRKTNEILTAGLNRVSGDKRFSILHDERKRILITSN